MHTRRATRDDALTIAQGEYETASTPGLLNAQAREIPLSAYTDKIESLTADPRGLYVVAQDKGTVIGHLLLDPMPLLANSHICTLTVVVYPRWQDRGVGRMLMEYAIAWAQDARNVEKIELMVRASNQRAVALYRSLGFEEEGRIRKRVKVDNAYHDDIAMALFV